MMVKIIMKKDDDVDNDNNNYKSIVDNIIFTIDL